MHCGECRSSPEGPTLILPKPWALRLPQPKSPIEMAVLRHVSSPRKTRLTEPEPAQAGPNETRLAGAPTLENAEGRDSPSPTRLQNLCSIPAISITTVPQQQWDGTTGSQRGRASYNKPRTTVMRSLPLQQRSHSRGKNRSTGFQPRARAPNPGNAGGDWASSSSRSM